MKLLNKRHKHFDIADKYRKKPISGYLLTIASRKAENEKKGKGARMLTKYVPTLSKEHQQAILNGERCLVGINVFFYGIDTKQKEE